MKKAIKLDKYEQDIEDNLERYVKISNEDKVKQDLINAAKAHLHARKPITIRISIHDIEIIKLKASKLGVPYQTYLNILIHKDAQSL